MQRINKLIIKNFKFFYGEECIHIGGKNLLIYGENGSGKSSIYWALYTFLQSVFKTENHELTKYFDPKNDQNLVNRFASDGAESSLNLEFIDDDKNILANEISFSKFETKDNPLIREAALGSDFIDHKVLSSIYNYYHKQEIDLFGFFQHHLFPFINFRMSDTISGSDKGGNNAAQWWKNINAAASVWKKKSSAEYKNLNENIKIFNDELNYYLNHISQYTNKYLDKHFQEKFNIRFDYRDATYNNSRNKYVDSIIPPQIILTVELTFDEIQNQDKKRISRPHSFLNEAKLSILALSMRLAILDEKYVEAYPKILVLDDFLMSMDMSNREFVLNIIFENFMSKYQILLFTHQRGLFEEARKYLDNLYSKKAKDSGIVDTTVIEAEIQKYWNIIEMYETDNINKIPIPIIVKHKDSLQKALYYFKENIDYYACGNNLRSALEEYFRLFIPRNKFRDRNGNPIEPKNLMLFDLLIHAKKYFNEVNFDTDPLDKLEKYKERSLNPASHYNPLTDFYKKELQEIFSILYLLKNNKRFTVIKCNETINFDINTKSGKVFTYEAKLLNDICVYNKNDGNHNYYVPTDVIGIVFTKCLINGEPSKADQKEKKTLQNIYEDTINYINKEEQAIEYDILDVFKDKNGFTLEQLKNIQK
jgi:energy-coupling factor transporter ATP-binding protein EcfA2